MNEHLRDKVKIHLDILAKSKPLESYCTNCGACCQAGVSFQKGQTEHRIYVNDLSCRHLKMVDGQSTCNVYSDRFEKANWCANTEEMIVKGLAPMDCPYVEGLNGYSPTLMVKGSGYSQLIPLLKLGISQGDREPFNQEQYDDFMKK
tara:strand:+ start:184 stop:624 length:441 start_codon:yes stop_codon:yes gene_type:complete